MTAWTNLLGYTTMPLAPSKGRLIRCTVPGSTPKRFAMTRTPGLPGIARASRIRFSSAGAIGGRPRRFPSTIVFDAGLNDLSTFNRRFRRLMGASPRAYRRHGRMAEVSAASRDYIPCPRAAASRHQDVHGDVGAFEVLGEADAACLQRSLGRAVGR